MLKKRLIPKLQFSIKPSYRGPKPVLVITRQFDSKRAIGDPVSQAKIYEAQLADELVLVDLEGTSDSWPILLDTLSNMSESLATPLSVGGGITSFEQVQQLLDRGADKVVLNSGAVNNPQLIDLVANSYGSQCVVISIDIRKESDLSRHVYIDGGSTATDWSLFSWANDCASRGAGELLITSIDNDGTGTGLDLDSIRQLRYEVNLPLIASGGCGLAQHFVAGYEVGASAVAAGTFFSQRDQNPMQCRSHIRNAGLPIRLEQ
ncbi:imidazoleglycerol-phosphate synthase, cyclase subunit [Prochlorococcus marinus str. MIT 9313]|uniref:Putative imidazole glycerol phosphate synthase subunit hisF2 n=1 Tax=Prochlorococcus marinus (strain MIT 9313) TaxID=74547 RepID=HIS62_PROMM|nr:HisA/HisF-related TIM barrel protein [Prochlorococcus marinus]Q7V958.1 RecName: Full=Putative imidazole glycerol phosphate synthase subunit hisF2; AltName: Full=IGP synthase cyclase subunit; AltName: Full=IGP synthase subunit hisF2; AltName: Full=ImGP synthase subunit hisF2; Short=IGPS subunit hisF2 [Prochlorococcus marinus str. MIT 9313]CAE20275.1 imidazoleglycerol-phosphate synthase, cyclase subunit [Prochlorococcus marinus str. MIT 9313]